VRHRVTLDLSAALGLFDAVEVYARLPVVLASRGEDAQLELVDFEAPSGRSAALVAERAALSPLRVIEAIPSEAGSITEIAEEER